MKICPIAIAVGCKKCPVFNVCPVKGIIGDYVAADDKPKGSGGKAKAQEGRKKG